MKKTSRGALIYVQKRTLRWKSKISNLSAASIITSIPEIQTNAAIFFLTIAPSVVVSVIAAL